LKSKCPIVFTDSIQNARRTASAPLKHGFSPSSDFWAHFIKHHWNREPLIIKNPFSPPITTTEEVFVTLRKVAEEFEIDGARVVCRLYRDEDGFRLEGAKLRRYLPATTDRSISAYTNRIKAKLKGERFGLLLHGFQAHDAQFYLRTREFLSGLAAQLPVHWTSLAVLFIGNYEQTPFGIHRDPANVFDFIVKGIKRIYIWPEDYFRDSFDKLLDSDFAILRKDATILEGEAGDILCWPPKYWHVGESVGDLSISVSLSLIPAQLSNRIVNEIKNCIEEDIGPSLNGDDGFPRSVGEVENSSAMIAATVRQATNLLRRTPQDFEFIQSLQSTWLNRMTSSGSHLAPPPLPIEILNDDYVVRGIPELPILWITAPDDQILCSANGHSFTLPAAPSAIRLLKELNSGAPLRVGECVKKFTGVSRCDGIQFNVSDEGIRFLLSKLYSLRAIEREM